MGKRGPLSEEHKAKLSVLNRGRKHTPEALEKIRLSWTPERRRKHGEMMLERNITQGWKYSRLGKTLSAETRAKMSAARKGKPKSKETRKRMSEAHKSSPRAAAARKAWNQFRTARKHFRQAIKRVTKNSIEE